MFHSTHLYSVIQAHFPIVRRVLVAALVVVLLHLQWMYLKEEVLLLTFESLMQRIEERSSFSFFLIAVNALQVVY